MRPGVCDQILLDWRAHEELQKRDVEKILHNALQFAAESYHLPPCLAFSFYFLFHVLLHPLPY